LQRVSNRFYVFNSKYQASVCLRKKKGKTLSNPTSDEGDEEEEEEEEENERVF
jgi:hypothetical protein